MTYSLIPPHGGYRKLKSYQMTEIIYDLTDLFCKSYMSYKACGSHTRTYDQMIQAARSGKQNIAEGCQVSGTSKKTELKLISVARGSLEELLQDYEDFLRQRSLPLWGKDHPSTRKIRALAYRSNKSYKTYTTYMSTPESAANCLICLIHQANYLLDQQLRSLEKKFLDEGGFTERLFSSRKNYRSYKSNPGRHQPGRDPARLKAYRDKSYKTYKRRTAIAILLTQFLNLLFPLFPAPTYAKAPPQITMAEEGNAMFELVDRNFKVEFGDKTNETKQRVRFESIPKLSENMPTEATPSSEVKENLKDRPFLDKAKDFVKKVFRKEDRFGIEFSLVEAGIMDDRDPPSTIHHPSSDDSHNPPSTIHHLSSDLSPLQQQVMDNINVQIEDITQHSASISAKLEDIEEKVYGIVTDSREIYAKTELIRKDDRSLMIDDRDPPSTIHHPPSNDIVINREVIDGVDVEYQIIDGKGVKEEIVIKAQNNYGEECLQSTIHHPPSINCSLPKNTYTFQLTLDPGVQINQSLTSTKKHHSGSFYFTDKYGRYLGHFLPPFAEDAERNRTNDVKMEIIDDRLWMIDDREDDRLWMIDDREDDREWMIDDREDDREWMIDDRNSSIIKNDGKGEVRNTKNISGSFGNSKTYLSNNQEVSKNRALQLNGSTKKSSGFNSSKYSRRTGTTGLEGQNTIPLYKQRFSLRSFGSFGNSLFSKIYNFGTKKFSPIKTVFAAETDEQSDQLPQAPDITDDREWMIDKNQDDRLWMIDGREKKNPSSINYHPSSNSPSSTIYHLTVTVDLQWLLSSDRVYPIRIDPSIVHDTEAEFDTADALNRVESVSGPKVQTNYHELPVDEHTVGLWHMNESGGWDGSANEVIDSSSNGNHGVRAGNATTTSTNAKLGGYSGTFDGTGDYVDCGKGSSLDMGTGDFTLEAWIKTSTTSTLQVISNKGDTSATGKRYIYYVNTDNQLHAEIDDNSAKTDIDGATTITDGKWHHVAFVADRDANGQLYLDGQADGPAVSLSSTTGSLDDTSKDFTVGILSYNESSYPFNGTIDEVVIHNRALTPEEIKANAQLRPYGVYTSDVLDLTTDVQSIDSLQWTENGVQTSDGETLYSSTDLVAQWNFNENSGTNADNAEGTAALDGTLTGFADTSAQDQVAGSGWTAQNGRWPKSAPEALMFDGSNDYVDIGDISGAGTIKTVEFWMKTEDVATNNIIDIDGTDYIQVDANGELSAVSFPGTTTYYVDSVSGEKTINAGQWHHVVVTDTTGVSGTDFDIGRVTASYYTGTMDSIRVYSRALSEVEVLSNYQSGNIEFQTRTGADDSPDDGSWEAWKPTTSETQILSMDSDVSNWKTSYNWYNENWNYRVKATIQNGKVDANLTDYPVYLDLSDLPAGFHSNVNQTDARDIRVTKADGITEVPREVVSYDSGADTGEIHFKASGTLSSSSNTDFYIYYGNSGVSDYVEDATYGAENVWDDNFKAVWHFNETSGNLSDSSGTSSTATQVGTPSYQETGKIGDSIDFDGDGNDYFTVNDLNLDAGFTLEAWLYLKGPGSQGSNEYGTWLGGDITHRLMWHNTTTYNLLTQFDGNFFSTSEWSLNTWHNITYKFDGSTEYWYGDGSPDGTNVTGVPDWSQNFAIARYVSQAAYAWKGTIDEIRISSTDRSATWISTTYNNQNSPSTFYSVGSEEGTPVSFSNDTTTYIEGSGSMKALLGAPKVDSSTVALWHFDETNGDLAGVDVFDETANNNDGELNGTAPGPEPVGGIFGKARDFNGSDDYINVTDASSLDLTNAGTIEVWLEPDTISSAESSFTTPWTQITGSPPDPPDGAATGDASDLDMTIVGNKRYYAAYLHNDAVETFWTAYSDLDGTNFSGWTDQADPDGAGATDTTSVAIGSDGLKLYYAAFAHDNATESFYTAYSDLDGTNFSGWTDQADPDGANASDHSTIDMTIVGSKCYYAAYLHDNTTEVFHTAYSDLDGTNFSGWTSQTAPDGSDDLNTTSVSLDSDGEKLYYAAFTSNGTVAVPNGTEYFYTNSSDLDGSNFGSWTSQTAPGGSRRGNPAMTDMAIVGDKMYFVAPTHESATEYFYTNSSDLDGSNFGSWTSQTAPGGVGGGETSAAAIATDGKDLYYVNFLHNNESEFLYVTSSTVTSHSVVSKADAYELIQTGGGFVFDWAGSPKSFGSISANSFSHIAITLDGTTMKYYVDGAEKRSQTVAADFTSNASALKIGGDSTWFNGTIDEVRISDTARTAEEIAEAYRMGRDHRLSRTLSSTDLSSKTKLPFYIAGDRAGTYLESTIGESSLVNYLAGDANLKALWHIDEESGSGSYIKDSSANAQHLSLNSAPTFEQGKIGKARHFDDADDYLTIADDGTFDLNGGSMSVAAWVKTDADEADNVIISKGASWEVGVNADGDVYWEQNTSQVDDTSTQVKLGSWHFVVVTNNDTTATYYVDGVLTGTDTAGINTDNDTALYIGYNGTNYFDGVIDEVLVTNDLLSVDEIRQLYEIGRRTHPITIDFSSEPSAVDIKGTSEANALTDTAFVIADDDMIDDIFVGDKVIVKENYGGTEYIVQSTVSVINTGTRTITVGSNWTGTVPNPGTGVCGGSDTHCFTTEADVFKWQREWFDISAPLSSHINATTNITLRATDGSEGRTFWLDDFKSGGAYLTDGSASSNVTSTVQRYLQYRFVVSSTDTVVTPYISSVTVNYTTGPTNDLLMRHGKWFSSGVKQGFWWAR